MKSIKRCLLIGMVGLAVLLAGCGQKKDEEEKVEESPKTMDTTLEQLTFLDFGLQDAAYSYENGDKTIFGACDGSLSGKVLNGDITFENTNSYLYVGGNPNVWHGLSLNSASENALILQLAGKSYTLTSEIAGTQLVGAPFNLKLSYQEMESSKGQGEKRLQLGVWINDKLYDNSYFYVDTYSVGTETETYENYLSGRIGFLLKGEGCGVTIASCLPEIVGEPEVLNPNLKRITFRDFDISDGSYGYTGDFSTHGLYQNGKADVLKNTVFVGDVTFESSASWFYIGGDDGLWSGLSLSSASGGNLALSIGGEKYTLRPSVAGTVLVKEALNLKLSYEVVTDEAQKEQLKLGVWINDRLYNNEYIYVQTYQSGDKTKTYDNYLHGRLGIFPQWPGCRMTLSSCD